jgi:hypothetical protein
MRSRVKNLSLELRICPSAVGRAVAILESQTIDAVNALRNFILSDDI